MAGMLEPDGSFFGGGVLVHMFAISDAQDLANPATPFVFEANMDSMVDCAAPIFKTCSAWTYLRLDLMPSIFCRPTANFNEKAGFYEYETPLIGVIVDPAKIKDYITNMGITDTDPVVKNCCATNLSLQAGPNLSKPWFEQFYDSNSSPKTDETSADYAGILTYLI